MSASTRASDGPASHVTSRSVAANLRVLSVRLDEADLGEGTVDLSGRIDQIVALFLEKHWGFPRRFVQIVPLSYLLFPGPDDEAFAETVEGLTTQLERHLFGEGVEVGALMGGVDDMKALAAQPEEAFRAAHAAVGAEEPAADEQPARVRVDPEDAWKRELRLFAGYDAPRKAVLCYIASLARRTNPTAQVLYHDSARVCGGRLDAFELAALRFAVARVIAKLETGAVCYCLVPLSFETLSDRRRRESYLKESAELPEELRRYIVPSVFGGPPGASSSSVIDMVGALRQWYANIDWQTRSCAIELDPMKHAGVFAMTLAPPQQPNDRAVELGRLTSFVRRTTALRIRPGVTGLASAEEVGAALAARAHFLSGPAVSGEMPELAPRIRVPIEALPLAS